MWQLFVTCRKRPNLIMALNNVCLMVSFLLVIKSLKTMGSQDVKRSHQRLWFELGAQSGVCVCVYVYLRGQAGVGGGSGGGMGAPCEMKLITSKGWLSESRWAAL